MQALGKKLARYNNEGQDPHSDAVYPFSGVALPCTNDGVIQLSDFAAAIKAENVRYATLRKARAVKLYDRVWSDQSSKVPCAAVAVAAMVQTSGEPLHRLAAAMYLIIVSRYYFSCFSSLGKWK